MSTSVEISPVLTSEELASLLAQRPDVRLLDVRTPAEFESAHIPGAYNVPLDTLSEYAQEIRSNVDTPLVLICRSGQRARQAEASLARAGMPNLHVLDGGLNGWVAADHAVRRGPERISLERQVRIAAGLLAGTGGALALAVNPLFAIVPALVGTGLTFAGITDTCALGMLLAKLPYNRRASCDIDTMVHALKTGTPPIVESR